MSWIRKWKTRKSNYSWKQIDKICRTIAQPYAGKFSCVIGLSRGGLIPATIIANHLNIRNVYSIGIASYETTSTGEVYIHKHNVYQQIPHDCSCMKRGDHVLIVDDISDKGATFNHVTHTYMSKLACEYTTLSLFIKPETAHIPDIYHESISQDRWVVFPWEKK